MKKLRNWIIKHKYNVGLVLFLLVLLFMFSYLKKFTNDELGKLYNITQIIGIFVTILGVIIAVRQYVQTSKNEITKFENEQVQKSIDLAEYYKNNILCNMVLIRHVYKETGMLDIVNKVKKSEMKDFDKHELDELFSNEDISKLKKIIMSDEFCEIVALVGSNYGINVLEKSIVKDEHGNPIKDEDGNIQFTVEVNKHKVNESFINKIVVETLNNLEYFSMHFTHNTADESVVYQSLHKTYLDVVQLLYYNIAVNNVTGESKFFTNVIDLFNTWQKKSQSIKEQEINLSRGVAEKGKKAKSF